MPSITNVGGSLTSAVALTLIAWAVRFVRARNSRKQDEKELHKQLGRFHASISAAALQLLVCKLHRNTCVMISGLPRDTPDVLLQVQTEPIPHVVIDIRDKQIAEQQPLPSQLGKAAAIPGMLISDACHPQIALRHKQA